MVELIALILVGGVALFADQLAPRTVRRARSRGEHRPSPPTLKGNHWFGTDFLGRDYLSRVIYGVRTSLYVALLVAFVATAIGTTVGAVSGYYGGRVDNLLMRFTDLVLTLPFLAVLLVRLGATSDMETRRAWASSSAFLFWTGLARIVRGVFLSLREKEFVEAAGGRGDRHAHHRPPHPARTASGRSSST